MDTDTKYTETFCHNTLNDQLSTCVNQPDFVTFLLKVYYSSTFICLSIQPYSLFVCMLKHSGSTKANNKKYFVSGAAGDKNKSQPGGRKNDFF